MSQPKGALSRFMELDGARSELKTRWEQYAAYTLPYLCPDDNFNGAVYRLSEVYDSVAAQGVTHLANKLMLAAFGSAVPFARLRMPKPMMIKLMTQMQITEDDVEEILSNGETQMLEVMAESGIRPELFELMKHLIVLGNVALHMDGDTFRAITAKDYVVKRSISGEVIELLVRHRVSKAELTDEVLGELPVTMRDNKEYSQVFWFVMDKGTFTGRAFIDDHELEAGKYVQNYDKDKLPYKVLTWVLPVKSDYGVGLIEENRGDIFMIDILSEALSDGAALASVYRWLVNPAGGTDIHEFEKSSNGSAFPGDEKDITLVQASNATQLQVVMNVMDKYERRLGAVFLKTSSVVRDSERTTAEEVRTLATELDTSFGGAYTRLSQTLQKPVADWLFAKTPQGKDNTAITPVIVTGMDALSRTAEAEKLLRFLGSLSQLTQLPPETQDYLKIGPIIKQIAASEGIASYRYVNTAEQAAQTRQARTAQAAQAAGQEAGAVASATNQQGV